MNILVFILILATILIIRKFAWNAEEGSNEQRQKNPELNTKDFDLHERRLAKFLKSKYKKRMFYIGTDSDCYYYTATGKKVFC
tara:strand:+ start:2048 stop:2296 length:249 start_codon:yes stop_codon:yes gene_type:complete